MELSYWEIKNWFTDVGFTIVGSGIVGLFTALRLREMHPKANILILEKGMLPQGASTKNAGFACFGSLSEIIDDLASHSPDEVKNLIQKRRAGLALLRKTLGDDAIDFKPYGGYELFLENDSSYELCLSRLDSVNELLRPDFGADVFSITPDRFGFGKVRENLIFNAFEAQIDTGNAMDALLRLAISKGIRILNNAEVKEFSESIDGVQVSVNDFSFKTGNLLFATNGFAAKLTDGKVKPARAQVLITNPIPGLDIKGTFHIDRGYYYFRNIGDRILFGGGRNLDFEGETTTTFGQTDLIQNKLEQMLKEVILPDIEFSIDTRWSGIMGMGALKSPVIEQISNRVFCGVRLGGMGVAIGSLVGKELAELTSC